MGISHPEMIMRIAVGAVLGGAIGMERDCHGRQAGLRTHFLVALASATFMVVSAHFHFFQNYGAGAGITADPSRIAVPVQRVKTPPRNFRPGALSQVACHGWPRNRESSWASPKMST